MLQDRVNSVGQELLHLSIAMLFPSVLVHISCWAAVQLASVIVMAGQTPASWAWWRGCQVELRMCCHFLTEMPQNGREVATHSIQSLTLMPQFRAAKSSYTLAHTASTTGMMRGTSYGMRPGQLGQGCVMPNQRTTDDHMSKNWLKRPQEVASAATVNHAQVMKVTCAGGRRQCLKHESQSSAYQSSLAMLTSEGCISAARCGS